MACRARAGAIAAGVPTCLLRHDRRRLQRLHAPRRQPQEALIRFNEAAAHQTLDRRLVLEVHIEMKIGDAAKHCPLFCRQRARIPPRSARVI